MLKKLIIFLTIIGFLFPIAKPLRAGIEKLEIKGDYNKNENRFFGHATYFFSKTEKETDRLLFHLPPNSYAQTDDRKEYWIVDKNKKKIRVKRSDLNLLKDYIHKDLHSPHKITINSVFFNKQQIPYKIKDNPDLRPLKNSKGAILEIKTNTEETRSDFSVTIYFSTEFNDLPGAFRRVLWDYTPRPILFHQGKLDLGDHYPTLIPTHTKIVVFTGTLKENTMVKEFSSHLSIPVFLVDNVEFENDKYSLSISDNLMDKKDYFKNCINRVLDFLNSNGWINDKRHAFRFIVWDGKSTTSGDFILLPERLLRYNSIYYKLVEISILKRIVESVLRQGFYVNSDLDPWIIPALQAEIIRSYIETVYNGDSDYFPWPDWINPDFYNENTIKVWITQLQEKQLISAKNSLDYAYFSEYYHPWYEKGFHLLETMRNSGQDFQPVLKEILSVPKTRNYLCSETFIEKFAGEDNAQKRGEKWLSVKGSVDYDLKDVDIISNMTGFKIVLNIENHGSLSPIAEIEFSFQDKEKELRKIEKGAGIYTFQFSTRPTQIILDPKHLLLENQVLNNYWNLPFSIRPIWDFSSADDWLLTISPLIGGNTFDSNLLGLNIYLGYLNETDFEIDIWESSNDEDILWESMVSHFGFPFKGFEISLKGSQLNASHLLSLRLRQYFKEVDAAPWVELAINEEDFQSVEGESVPEGQEKWREIEISASLPLYEGSFSTWIGDLQTNYGKTLGSLDLCYRQLFIAQEYLYIINEFDIHFKSSHGFSNGTIPLQKRFSIGGPEGISGFPRSIDLLFEQRNIFELGTKLPPFFTHTSLNLLRLIWLQRIVPTLNAHVGYGVNQNSQEQVFQDVEINFNFYVELLNTYSGSGMFAVAWPIDHEEYKDARFILFSSWVF